MRDWLTYRLSDFLLFSPRTYYRMFELYHRDIWPAQIVSVALIGVVVLTLVRPGRHTNRIIAGVLAAAWLWAGIAFHLWRYASINWAATYFGALFIAQAVLLAWVGVARPRPLFEHASAAAGRWAAIAFLTAVVLAPLAGALTERSLAQVEVFALTPDATAIATVAVLLFVRRDLRRLLLVAPIVWCLVSAATLRALDSNESRLGVVAALIALGSLVRRGSAADSARA